MGRHSIPDPEDAPDEPDHGHVGDSDYGEDYDRPRGEQSRYAEDDFDTPGRQPDRGYRDAPAYRDDRGYRSEPEPAYRPPQYADGDDDYESDYHDSEYADYDEAEYVEEDGYEDEYVDGYRDQYAAG